VKIKKTFENLKISGKKALIPFVTAGDPNYDVSLEILKAISTSGADIIELGMPFSDPMADGPSIQKANERSIKNGFNMNILFRLVSEFRKFDPSIPIVLMGYMNPIEAYGFDNFLDKLIDSKIDGLLIVDSPPEESSEIKEKLSTNNIDLIFLLSPTSTNDRIKMVSNVASGYVYYVSVKGVTGSKNININEVKKKIDGIKSLINLPVGVGFGINEPDVAKKVSALADGVIVGSKIINEIEKYHLVSSEKCIRNVKNLISSFRLAIDN
jgi:tryptophan synthase alpha chain